MEDKTKSLIERTKEKIEKEYKAKKLAIGKTYKALKNLENMKKGKIYELRGQKRLKDPRGWAYDDYELIFTDVETGKEITETNLTWNDIKPLWG